MNWFVVVVAALGGYAVGSVSPATLVAHHYGQDLRSSGSGNPGATNVGRVVGRRAGVLVAVLDVAKGFVPAFGFGFLSSRAGLVAGLFAVLGHVTSPLLRGRGGKGVATTGGAVLGSHPLWAVPVVVVWLLVVAGTRWIAFASVCAAVTLAVVSLLVRAAVVDVLWAFALATIVVARHWANFARWLAVRRSTDLP